MEWVTRSYHCLNYAESVARPKPDRSGVEMWRERFGYSVFDFHSACGRMNALKWIRAYHVINRRSSAMHFAKHFFRFRRYSSQRFASSPETVRHTPPRSTICATNSSPIWTSPLALGIEWKVWQEFLTGFGSYGSDQVRLYGSNAESMTLWIQSNLEGHRSYYNNVPQTTPILQKHALSFKRIDLLFNFNLWFNSFIQ